MLINAKKLDAWLEDRKRKKTEKRRRKSLIREIEYMKFRGLRTNYHRMPDSAPEFSSEEREYWYELHTDPELGLEPDWEIQEAEREDLERSAIGRHLDDLRTLSGSASFK